VTTVAALRERRPVERSVWPEPPSDLAPSPRDPTLATGYVESTRDRLAKIDAALAAPEHDDAVWLAVYREIHTIKGASLAVGDEVMAWFCHGLEEHMRSLRSPASGLQRCFDDVLQYRPVVNEILESPEHGLATLRVLTGAKRPSVRPPIDTPLPLPPKRPSFNIDRPSDARALADDSVRVATATLERLFERAAQLAQVGGPISGNVTALEKAAQRANDIHRSLREALRMIGPPRPWGAPAAAIDKVEHGAVAIAAVATSLDDAAHELRRAATRVSHEGTAMQAAVTSMRTTLAARLFETIATATAQQARREGKEVDVTISGGDTPIDRRLAEALADPLAQIANNAIAHGLETPEARTKQGKLRTGSVVFRAALRAGSLMIEVSDDGAGVDTDHVRRWAIESGTVRKEVAPTLPERTLLSLLFIPGFTTKKTADLLAGRGVGLDLTLAAVHRLGGTIQLFSERGRGLTATVVVPAEGALVRALWVGAGGLTFALPLLHTGRVVRAAEAGRPILALMELLPPGMAFLGNAHHPPPLAIEVIDPSEEHEPTAEPLLLGIDAVGAVEDVMLRALAPIVKLNGPFAAAILWGDEIRLSLDPDALLARTRATA
jgi:chemotaxis protein histidine kinase CheA